MPLLRPRLPFAGVALGAVAGIVASDFLPLPPWQPLALCALLAAWTIVRPRTIAAIALAFAAFFSLHTLRHHGDAGREFARELLPRQMRVTGIVWSEPEAPAFFSRRITAHFRLRVERVESDGIVREIDTIANAAWAGAMPAYGDRVELSGLAEPLAECMNPGEFDTASFLRRKGIHFTLTARHSGDCRIVAHDAGSSAQAFAFRARRWLKGELERDLGDAPEIASLIQSMVLGLRGETPEDVRECFQRTGTLHLFAVSGLNIALLATIVWSLLKPLRFSRRVAVFITIPVLCGYALVTGLSASCVRATIMGALLLIAHPLDRPAVALNSLAASAVAIIAWDSEQLFSPGFQFSFVLVFVLVIAAKRIERRFARLGQPDDLLPRSLWNLPQRISSTAGKLLAQSLGVTLGAWLGSLAFTAGYFHLFSPSAIFANLVAVPLAFCILAIGLLAVLCAPWAPVLTAVFNNANWACAWALLRSVEFFAILPGGHVYVELPAAKAAPACEFTVFDLGEGGAIHLRAGREDWLVDCGPRFRYGSTVLPYLRSRGINRLDALVLTHGDANHIGAAISAIDDFNPRRIVDAPQKDRSTTRRALHRDLAAADRGRCIVSRGDEFTIGAATLRVLYPPAGLQRNLADDKALVLLFECDGVRVLFMADSGFATEQWLLENEPGLRADVLVKGQHSRDLSGTPDFLARIAPLVVIAGPLEFGALPAQLDPWVRDAESRGIAIFRQDTAGAVRCEIVNGGFELRSHAGGQIFRSRAR